MGSARKALRTRAERRGGRSIVNIEDEEDDDDDLVVWTQSSSASQRGRGSGVCCVICLSFMPEWGLVAG